MKNPLVHCRDCGAQYRFSGLYPDGRCRECHVFVQPSQPRRVCTCTEPIRLSMGVCGRCCGRMTEGGARER